MYPTSYHSSGPYPCYPSSSNSYPFFPFLNPENASSSNNNNNNNHTLLHDPLSHVSYNLPSHHHIHNTPITQETLTNLAVSAAAAMPKQDPIISGGGGAHHHYGLSSLLTKKPAKKDRHSKIYTAQGLRDRRVRLSIQIARKFFDLQDMLGFDKASNTLEWLFNKSKRAIKELAKSKNISVSEGDAKSFSSSSDCEDCNEVVSGINHEQQGITIADHDALNLQQQQGLDSNAVKEMRKLKRAQKEPACVRAKMKESREKARARARERTSNKMCNTDSNNGRVVHVQDLKKKCIATTENNTHTLQQLRSPLQLEECARSPNNKLLHPHFVSSSEAPRDDNFNVIEESIVIRRKLKPSMMSSSHHHHHQNLMIPKEASFNNNNNTDYNSFTNLSPNWDNANNGGNGNGRSNFCTIASMNLSTGLQIFGKSWE